MNTWIKTTGLSFIFAASLSSNNMSNAAAPTQLWQVSDFDQPESVVVDEKAQSLYVSNINGQPIELNGKGYISKLSMNGKILKKEWLSNLNAPKGMAIYGDNLYIADMQHVHLVSISEARIIKKFEVKQAKMLNDITVTQNGTVFISDLLGGGIYRIEDNKITHWFNHADLPHPNGLLWQQDKLFVASWGVGMNNDFSTQKAGSVYTLNINKPELTLMKASKELGNLDGLVQHENSIYASDWISGELFKIEKTKSSKVLTLKPGLADIAGSGSILFTPSMLDGQVSAWKL
jgi:sugar lactone lactonase YvrE